MRRIAFLALLTMAFGCAHARSAAPAPMPAGSVRATGLPSAAELAAARLLYPFYALATSAAPRHGSAQVTPELPWTPTTTPCADVAECHRQIVAEIARRQSTRSYRFALWLRRHFDLEGGSQGR
jgi:hypothetical protein